MLAQIEKANKQKSGVQVIALAFLLPKYFLLAFRLIILSWVDSHSAVDKGRRGKVQGWCGGRIRKRR